MDNVDFMSPVLACPHCGLALAGTQEGAACANGHSFDRAREGYLNLLVGGRLAAATTPGDTAGSLSARRRFLSTGAYSPIADAVVAALGTSPGPVLDIGCGEGWYMSRLAQQDLVGIDISKRAVQMAAKALPHAAFAVASAFRMPVRDGSCGAVVSVFAPHPFDEIDRVLAPEGIWVTATPGPRHLQEMRPEYSPGAPANARFDRRAEPPAGAVASARVTFELDLTEQMSADLYVMTPLQFQAGAVRADIDCVTVDVWVSYGTPGHRHPAPL